MSGARVASYVLSAAEIEALVREQQRLSLCATADTMAARAGPPRRPGRAGGRSLRGRRLARADPRRRPIVATSRRWSGSSPTPPTCSARPNAGSPSARTAEPPQWSRRTPASGSRQRAGRVRLAPATDRAPHPAARRDRPRAPAAPPDRTRLGISRPPPT